jgi:hypothetical protein
MAAAQTGWVDVPFEVAKRHELYGPQGWLYLVMLGCIVAPVRIGFTLYPIYSDIDFSALQPLLATFIFVEVAINAIVIVWSIANLWLLASINRWFPTSFVALLAFSVVFLTLDAVAAKFVMDATGGSMTWAEAFEPETSREIGRSVFTAAVWIPYMFVSRRVNVTYRHRVRANDPLVAANAESAA